MSYKLTFLKEADHKEFTVDAKAYYPKRSCVTIIGAPAIEGGFTLENDKGWKLNNYNDFKTIYKKYSDVEVAYSSDGSTFESDEEIAKIKTVTFNDGQCGYFRENYRQEAKDFSEIVVPTVYCNENYHFTGWDKEIPESGIIEKNCTFTAQYEYIAPVIPEPEPYIAPEPSLEEVKQNLIENLNLIQQEKINNGTDIMLADGTIEHFTATDADQRSLAALQAQVMLGSDKIPWHNNDQLEGCKYYSNADMSKIIEGVTSYVTYHVTYFRDLRKMILLAEDKEALSQIYYGMPLSEEFQSEVLKDLYAQLAGIQGTDEVVLFEEQLPEDNDMDIEPSDVNPDTNTEEAGPDDTEEA